MTRLNKKYAALRLKLMVITFCFTLVPLAALGYFIQASFSRTYQDKITGNLRLVVQNKRDTIDMFLDERISQLKNLAYSYTFKNISDPTVLSGIYRTIQSNSGSFIDLGIIDSSGAHAAYIGPYPLENVNYSNEPWFHKVMLKGLFISDVFMGFRHFPHFIIAVRRQEGERSWVLRATIDSDVFTSLVRNVQMGLKGDAFLINSRLILQTSSRFAGEVLTQAKLPELTEGTELPELMDWKDGNDNMLAGTARLKNTDWSLVVVESPTEELSPLMKTQSISFALIGFGMCMILGGAYLTTGSILKKLMQSEREKALMDATVMQSNKMASLGKLAAGVAHEINNPLTIIRESAGWIRDVITDGELGESQAVEELAEAVEDIDRHVERARNVTHRMLGFARRMEPKQEGVDLNTLARQTAGFLESEALHRNIDMNFELEESLPGITTDANQLQQVILNLMENAIDAMDREGTLTLRTFSSDNSVFMQVCDTGPGIPKENLTRIFDPFFTTKPVGEGTGLGLSIIYSTMQRLGGNVSAENSQEKGARFTISLPRDRGAGSIQ